MATRKRKIASPKLPMQRQFSFAEQGRFFNLRAIFKKLNAKYFGNRLRGYSIVWGRKRKQRRRPACIGTDGRRGRLRYVR